jgi:hypothetical protein
MTEKTAPITTVYYISPTNKIHSNQCRHFKADSDGWQKMDSYPDALTMGAKPCRICCPEEEIDSPQETSEKECHPNQQDLFAQLISTEEQSEFSTSIEDDKTDEQPKSLSIKDKGKKIQPKKKNKKDKKTPVKRYKILAGNGCHQAIAEVQGILVPPIDAESNHQLILPDGLAIEATFADSYLKWLAFNQPNISGAHWFRGYPKMKDDKLIAFQIIGRYLNKKMR